MCFYYDSREGGRNILAIGASKKRRCAYAETASCIFCLWVACGFAEQRHVYTETSCVNV